MIFIFILSSLARKNKQGTGIDSRINFIYKANNKLWGAAMSLAWANWANTTK